LRKITLDARELEHPIPLQLALSHLRKMDKDEFLYMIHRKNPIPLIEIAKEKSYSHLTKNHQDEWHILISKNSKSNLEELLDV
jgi:TusA-related sulfurtransferase